MNHRISNNFWSKEIFPGCGWEDVPKNSRYLASHLCDHILQPIRNTDKRVRIDITGPARNSLDVIRLIRQGYHPSVTTDHFFGVPQTIPAIGATNLSKIERYGEIYTYSVGAVDIRPDIPQTLTAFMGYYRKMVIMNEARDINAGQIILEKGKYTYWIHVSNPVSLVYYPNFIKEMVLQKSKYLISLNNDGRYKQFTL